MRKIRGLFGLALAMVTVLQVQMVNGYLGPRTYLELLKPNQETNNVNDNAMNLEFFVFTDGISTAYFYMETYLLMNGQPAEGSIIHFGSFMQRKAGSIISYDVGLCSQLFLQEDKDVKPEIRDLWIETEITPELKETILDDFDSSLDILQDGQDDWEFFDVKPWNL